MGKTKESAFAPFEAKIARLKYLKSLLPADNDYDKYGLTDEELGFNPASYVSRYFTGADVGAHLLLLVTVLRKRRAETPGNLLSYRDLVDLIVITTRDEDGKVTDTLLRDLQNDGVIQVNRRMRVSIKI